MEELPRTSLYLLSYQLPSLFFSLTLLKMRPAIFKYSLISECLAMSKSAAISKWQLSSTLANFPLLGDFPSVKLTSENAIKEVEDCKYLTSTQNLPEASFDFSHIAQTVEFFPDNIVLLSKKFE